MSIPCELLRTHILLTKNAFCCFSFKRLTDNLFVLKTGIINNIVKIYIAFTQRC